MKKIKTEINLMLENEELAQRILINDGERVASLSRTADKPDGIEEYGSSYYDFKKAQFDDSEIDLYIKLRQLKNLDTIKKCCIFFVVLAAVGLAVSLICGINVLNSF